MEKYLVKNDKIVQISNDDINFNKIELIETQSTCCFQKELKDIYYGICKTQCKKKIK